MENLTHKIGFIYRLTSPNGKIYIGQTINFEQRCRKYKYKAFKGQIKLWNSCEKYNWNPIETIEIIEICKKDELDIREKYWIEKYDSYNNGLNSDLGGNSRLGFKHSPETKEKLSLANKGKKHSNETKQKISFYCRNRSEEINKKISDSNKGKRHSDETKIKIREKNLGKKLTNEQRLKISINNLGNKKRLNKTHSNETKKKISEKKKGISNIDESFKIICITTGEIFRSQQDAATKLNLKQSSISRVCNGVRKSYNKMRFMFYDEYLKMNKK